MAPSRLARPRPDRPLLDPQLDFPGVEPLGFLFPLAGIRSHRGRPRLFPKGALPADPQPHCLCRSLLRIGPRLVALRVDPPPDAELVISRRGGLPNPSVRILRPFE